MINILIKLSEPNRAQYESIYSEIINWCIDTMGSIQTSDNYTVVGAGWELTWTPKRRCTAFEQFDSFKLSIDDDKIGLVAMLKFGNKD